MLSSLACGPAFKLLILIATSVNRLFLHGDRQLRYHPVPVTRNEKQRGCNDEAIRAAEEEGLIKPVARTFEYVGGRVTDMPSGFFHKFPSFVENPSGGQR